MSDKPDFIDNIDGNTLYTALRKLLDASSSETPDAKTGNNDIEEARIATAYFSPGGFTRIAPAIASISSIKLLLGTDPMEDHEIWQKKLNESKERFILKRLRESLTNQEEILRTERDNIPFDRASSSSVKQLIASLRRGNMEVRRYEKQFLHGKAYIFAPKQGNECNDSNSVIIGSSNLTA
ncbi:MAG TPA: hypothetical protein DCE22_02100, partial [Verrucomicrobiales bacterium]|nr:hypothetical protein [Verrucomicrobiales bacterium]